MFNVIVAVSKQSNGKLGIGIGNKMAWKCAEELKLFKEKTMGNVLIMGKSTVKNLPKLNGREIYCLSRDTNTFARSVLIGSNPVNVFQSFTDAVRDAKERHPDKKIFVAGGEQIYDLVMNNHKHNVKELHISFMKLKSGNDSSKEDIQECNKFFTTIPGFPRCVCLSHKEYPDFIHYVLDINETNNEEYEYLELLKQVLKNGIDRQTRNSIVKSEFIKHLTFDLRNGFPLLTTKKMFMRGVIEELLFFLRGDTDSTILEQKNINIWKGNTSREFLDNLGMVNRREGVMGPCFPSGTPVLTRKGYKLIEEIDETDMLYTHTGEWKQIIECFKRKWQHDMINMKVTYHPNLLVTPEHPFYAKRYTVRDSYRGKRSVPFFSSPEWIEAKDIDNRCVIGMKIEEDEIEPVFDGYTIQTEEEWFMIGFFLGDGWIQTEGDNRYRICFAINDKEHDVIVHKLRKVLNIQCCETYDHCYKYRCGNDKYTNILKTLGKYAHGKIIPDWIHKAPCKFIKWFLDGFFAADGCIRKNTGSKRYTTVSTDIAYSIQRLYLKLGLFSSINLQTRSNYKKVFGDKYSYLHDAYGIEVYENIKRRGNYSHIEDGYAWFDVSKSVKIDQVEETYVYNFDVEDVHTYTVHNLAAHNCYGYQWRYFNAEYDEETANPKTQGIDQLSNVIELIKSDPTSRRIFMTDYNPSQLDQCVLPPCHSIVLQFYVDDDYIDLFCYNRSQDLFLGTPFNIASTSVLLILISKLTNKIPRHFHLSLGDAHIYEQHIDSVKTQISRFPCRFPKLKIEKDLTTISDIENLTFENFSLEDYNHHPSIKAEMVA